MMSWLVCISLCGAHLQDQNFVSVKSSRSLMNRICSGGSCYTADAVKQNAYKIDPKLTLDRKIHIEHKKISEIIDINELDLHILETTNIKSNNTISTIQLTDRSLVSQELQPVDVVMRIKPVENRSTWQYLKNKFTRRKDVNALNRQGVRPLHQAIIDGNLKDIMNLVLSGADINIPNSHGDSTLHIAIRSFYGFTNIDKNAVIFEFLLEHGARIDAKNKLGQTPLHCAAANLEQEIVNILIDYKANLNVKDNQGRTPLMAVINRSMPLAESGLLDIQQKKAEVIQSLIRAGADISIRDSNNRLPIDDANY